MHYAFFRITEVSDFHTTPGPTVLHPHFWCICLVYLGMWFLYWMRNSTFAHPIFHISSDKHFWLFHRSDPSKATSEVWKLLDDVTSACSEWKEFSTWWYGFRESMPSGTTSFNHYIAIDLLWLDIRPVLPIMCTHTLLAMAPGAFLSLQLISGLLSQSAGVLPFRA